MANGVGEVSSKLYKGNFNYSGELFELYTHAGSPELAFLNFVTQLSKQVKVGKRTIMNKFDGSSDNYYIEEVKE